MEEASERFSKIDKKYEELSDVANAVKTELVCSCSCKTEELAEEVAQLKKNNIENAEAPCSCYCKTDQLAEEVAQLKKSSIDYREASCSCSCKTEQLAEEVAQLKKSSIENTESPCSCSCKTEHLAEEVAQLKKSSIEYREAPCSCSCKTEQLAEEVAQLKKNSIENREAPCSCPCKTEQLAEEVAQLRTNSTGKSEAVCVCTCKTEQLEKEVAELKISSGCKEYDVNFWTKETGELVEEMAELKSYLGLARAVNAKATVTNLTEKRLTAFRKEFASKAKVSEMEKQLDVQADKHGSLAKYVEKALQQAVTKSLAMEKELEGLSSRVADVEALRVPLDVAEKRQLKNLESRVEAVNTLLELRLDTLDKKLDLSVEQVTQLFQEANIADGGSKDLAKKSGVDAEVAKMVKRLEGKNAEMEKKLEALTNIALKVSG